MTKTCDPPVAENVDTFQLLTSPLQSGYCRESPLFRQGRTFASCHANERWMDRRMNESSQWTGQLKEKALIRSAGFFHLSYGKSLKEQKLPCGSMMDSKKVMDRRRTKIGWEPQ